MKASNNAYDLIRTFEGFSPTIYVCPAGKETIGIGHCLTSEEMTSGRYDHPISIDQANIILGQDLGTAELGINRLVTTPINQNQFDALCSFAFNLGVHALAGSTLLGLINQGRFSEAGNEFIKWDHCNGKELDGLKRRRIAEAELFNKTEN